MSAEMELFLENVGKSEHKLMNKPDTFEVLARSFMMCAGADIGKVVDTFLVTMDRVSESENKQVTLSIIRQGFAAYQALYQKQHGEPYGVKLFGSVVTHDDDGDGEGPGTGTISVGSRHFKDSVKTCKVVRRLGEGGVATVTLSVNFIFDLCFLGHGSTPHKSVMCQDMNKATPCAFGYDGAGSIVRVAASKRRFKRGLPGLPGIPGRPGDADRGSEKKAQKSHGTTPVDRVPKSIFTPPATQGKEDGEDVIVISDSTDSGDPGGESAGDETDPDDGGGVRAIPVGSAWTDWVPGDESDPYEPDVHSSDESDPRSDGNSDASGVSDEYLRMIQECIPDVYDVLKAEGIERAIRLCKTLVHSDLYSKYQEKPEKLEELKARVRKILDMGDEEDVDTDACNEALADALRWVSFQNIPL